MYLRMGFIKLREAPEIYGVPYAVYTRSLSWRGWEMKGMQRWQVKSN